MHELRYPRMVVRFVALLSVYVLCTWYSDAFILGPGQVTLFWPAAGVAYAIVLLYGARWSLVIPIAVLVGHLSFAPVPPLFLPFSVLSNFAGALAALWLVARRDRGIRVTMAGGFLMLRAAVVMCVVSAAIGITGLLIAGMIPIDALAAGFVKWSMGDLLGILCVAPTMLLLFGPKPSARQDLLPLPADTAPAAEIIAWAIALLLAFGAVYWAGVHQGAYALATVALPLTVLLWSALRFPPLWAALGTGVSILFITTLTGLGLAGFASPDTLADAAMLLGFLILFASVPLMLMASVHEQRTAARRQLRETARRAEDQRQELERQVAERTAELHALNQRLQLASQTDPLTGLRNRRYLTTQLPADLAFYDREKNRSHEGDQPVVLALVDIDHFKRINDSFGHKAGDAVLQQFADRLTRLVRTGDYVVRWGGEEFLLVFRPMPRQVVPILAERIRECIRREPFEVEGIAPLALTCSTGLSEYPLSGRPGSALSWEQMVELADNALYWVKQHGRDGWALLRPAVAADADALAALAQRLHLGAEALLADGSMVLLDSGAGGSARGPAVQPAGGIA